MVKVKGSRSKRVDSAKRHKIERKKREHKRDLRRAAKAIKKSGLGPKRSKKSREAMKMALKISNSDPDKEKILERLLQARENARVMTKERRAKARADVIRTATTDEENKDIMAKSNTKQQKGPRELLYIPVNYHYDMMYQFKSVVRDVVIPVPDDKSDTLAPRAFPCSAVIFTCDARCAVQSIPWTLLDYIVEQAAARFSALPADKMESPVLVVIALNKIDLVSPQVVGSDIMMLDHVLHERYGSGDVVTSIPGVEIIVSPVSCQLRNSVKHLLKILQRRARSCTEISTLSNMSRKTACLVLGLQGTGRKSLCRSLLSVGGDSAIASIPIRAMRVRQPVPDSTDSFKSFIVPNSRETTLLSFSEDAQLRALSGQNVLAGDIIFHSASFIEKMKNPEVIATIILGGFADKIMLSQAFCQPLSKGEGETTEEELFLRGLGNTIRHHRGFYSSALLFNNAATAGQLSASSLVGSSRFTSQSGNLLNDTYSNATPAKFVRAESLVTKGKKRSGVAIRHADIRNALTIGARTFIREFYSSRTLPWAVMSPGEGYSPLTTESSSYLRVLSLAAFSFKEDAAKLDENGRYPFLDYADVVSSVLREDAIKMPKAVVEFAPNFIAPVLHDVSGEFSLDAEDKEESEEDDEEFEEDKEEEEEKEE